MDARIATRVDRPRLPSSPLAVALVGFLAVVAVLRLHVGTAYSLRAVDDLGQLVAAAVAAACCLGRARLLSSRARWSWALVGLGLAAWSAGELMWSYYELVLARETPFPSFADLGYLLFPVLALAGLLARPSPAFAGTGRIRVVLDGGMVASALFVLSWATTLGHVFHAGADNTFAMLVGLAYPVGDLVLLTTALLVAVHSRLRRSGLVLVAGMACMALADSGFSYLTAVGRYRTGSVVDIAWLAAFVLMGLSAVYYSPPPAEDAERTESLPLLVLPYLLVVGAVVCAVTGAIEGGTDIVTLTVTGFSLTSLLARQLLTMLDNRRLADRLLAEQHELQYRAFHDALTGLANRALFFDRLGHALQTGRRTGRPVSILFCDLDDFKITNDTHGHGVGDQVLQEIGARLTAVLRAGDTVARLGGDEFAVLLEDEHDIAAVCARIEAAVSRPIELSDRAILTGMSIGRTTVDTSDESATLEHVMRLVDTAMYRAKRARKLQAASQVQPRTAPDADDGMRRALLAALAEGRVRTEPSPIAGPDRRLWAVRARTVWTHDGLDVPPEDVRALLAHRHERGTLDLLVADAAIAAAAARDAIAMVTVHDLSVLDGDFVDHFAQSLREHALPADRLIVKIADRDALTKTGTAQILGTIRAAGARLALDGFGDGGDGDVTLDRYALLRPDVVTVGRGLVAPLLGPARDTTLLAAVVELAHDLGSLVVAEGVEDARQFDTLAAIGVDGLEGTYLVREQPLDDLAAGPAYFGEDAVPA